MCDLKVVEDEDIKPVINTEIFIKHEGMESETIESLIL